MASNVMADGGGPQPEVSKPYTTPKGFKAPTIGEQWRYVSAQCARHAIQHC